MSGADAVHIRPATLQDAEAVAALSAQTFRETFTKDTTAQDMDAYVANAFGIDGIQKELAGADNLFLLAFERAKTAPVGYAKLRTDRTEPCVEGAAPIELERLYVTRAMLGKGVGASLMRASLHQAQTSGYRTVWLGVWERNFRAIAFYERWHFKTVGSHPFQVGSDIQTDLIMARPVPAKQR